MLSNVNSGSTSIIMRLKQKSTKFKLFKNAIDDDVCEGTSSSISINPLLRKLDGIFKLKYISCAYKRVELASSPLGHVLCGG